MIPDPIGFDDATQLLQEGGCSGEFIQIFLAAMETKTTKDLFCMLRCQRNLQLGKLHEEGKSWINWIVCGICRKNSFPSAQMRNSVVKGEYLAWYSENVTFQLQCTLNRIYALDKPKNLRRAVLFLSSGKQDVYNILPVPPALGSPQAGLFYAFTASDFRNTLSSHDMLFA